MAEDRKPVRIAINIMRARLTVIGFNVAIVSFQIAQLYSAPDGFQVPGMGHAVHVVHDIQLFMALSLSFMALLAFVMSAGYDEVGFCTHWSLVAGDIFMYLALARTLSGFFAPLTGSMEIVAGQLPDHAAAIGTIKATAIVAGGVTWFAATYVGPLVALVRSPFPRRTNIALGIGYLMILLALCWIAAQTVRVEASVHGEAPGMLFCVLREFVQPLRW